MKTITTLLLLLFAGSVAMAQNVNQGGPQQSHFFVELPYHEVNSKIIIEIEVGGSKHNFLFDTGAPNQIEPATAKQLQLTNVTKAVTKDAYNNIDTIYTSPIPAIKLGTVTFAGVPALIKDLGIFKCYNIDGVIGSNMVRNCIVQLNSANKTLIITDDASRLTLNPKNAIKLNTQRDSQSSPYIVISVGQHATGEFLFDSGNLGFIEVSQNYMDIFKKANAVSVMASGYGSHSFSGNGAEQSAAKKRIKFDTMQIGGGTFNNVITETSLNNSSTGNRIGANLVNYGTVTIDYLHNKFYFEPITPQTDLNEKTWQVSPTFANGQLVIGLVWDKLKDKVKPGEQIIAINDVSTEHVDICDLVTHKSILNGKEQATLTLRNDKGVVTKLEIVKE